MKVPSVLLAVFLLADASYSRAEEPLTTEDASAQVKGEFARLRGAVPKEDSVTLARIDRMEVETQRSFLNYRKTFPDRYVFPVDVKYVTQSFEQVILPRLLATAKVVSDAEMSPEKKREKLAALEKADEASGLAFNTRFFKDPANSSAIFTAAQSRGRDGDGYTSNQALEIYSPLIGAAVDGSRVAFSNGNEVRGQIGQGGLGINAGNHVASDQNPTKPATRLTAEQIANVSADPKNTKAEVNGDLASAGRIQVLAKKIGTRLPDDTLPAPVDNPVPPSPWIRPLRAINAGVPQAYSEQSGVALRSGRYSDASRWARTALQFNPNDKNALFVLASAKGRVEADVAALASRAAASTGLPPARPADSGFAGAGAGGRDSRATSPAPAPASATAPALGPVVVRASTREAVSVAQTALRLGDAGTALEQLDKALLKDPESLILLGLRAQTYGRLGRWEEALKDADKALAVMPGNIGLLITKSISENRTGRWRHALATSERMIAADPGSAWGYAARAHAWGGLGNRDAMISDINRAASLDASFKPAAAAAAALQLPTDSDMLFLFPGEKGSEAAGPTEAPVGGSRGFGFVLGASIAGGLLLALGLLSIVLPPLKAAVVSVFTKTERHGPAVGAVPEAAPAPATTLIRGQYQLARQIGQGGMGTVYEGVDRNLSRKVAIKKMREELRINARERERFVIEAKTVASLHHANIVDIYAIAEEGDDVYLIFEYVEGKTVHDLVQASGRLGMPEAVSVTRSMGEALTYAHSRGVIHRDMKPSNVMLSSAGEIKVMDFGIARMAKDAMTRYSMTNTIVGTPPYMAPEQEQGVVRRESDVYALAICAYEMLTGKLPFIGMGAGMLMNKINMSYIAPSRAIAGLPEALDEVFLKAFQADPEKRHRTPQEFVAALAAAADGARSKST